MHTDRTQPPRIGASWPGQGGIYAGVARGRDGAPNHHLIVASPSAESLDWQDAMRWAKTIEIEGHGDFDLPDRAEQPLLFANVPEFFENDWYWSGAQYASLNDFAWCQSFGNGGQSYGHESTKLRARAVRRLVIE